MQGYQPKVNVLLGVCIGKQTFCRGIAPIAIGRRPNRGTPSIKLAGLTAVGFGNAL
jgi:hypothetical protein